MKRDHGGFVLVLVTLRGSGSKAFQLKKGDAHYHGIPVLLYRRVRNVFRPEVVKYL